MLHAPHHLGRALTMTLLCAFIGGAAYAKGVRYPGCIAEALTQSAPINNDGTFKIRNVPADGTTRFQTLITCPSPVRNAGRSARSGFFALGNGQTISVPPLDLVEFVPVPEGLELRARRTELQRPGERVDAVVVGIFAGDDRRNLTHPMNGTTFRTTNPKVVRVDNTGCVTAVGRGVAIVSAFNQGRTATRRFLVRSDRGIDTDGDGMIDSCEVARGLDPRSPYDSTDDNDGDGVINRDECFYGADPFSADGDADGLTDPEEIARGTDPSDADTDDDELSDGAEITATTDPFNPNTDGDCLDDGIEVAIGLDPRNAADGPMDKDNDGLASCDEAKPGTDPGNPDTDDDGLLDGEELTPGVDGKITDPLEVDTDLDELNDGVEVALGTDPTDPTTRAQDVVLDGRTVTLPGRIKLRSLTLANGSVLSHPGATLKKASRLELIVDTLVVDATSRIDATGRGFLGGNQGGNGPAGRTLGQRAGSQRRVGGSYGGLGGIGDFDQGRDTIYGDYRDPDELGSGGGSDCGAGGNGGGIVRITATTAQIDGQILADGQDGQGNCGGGGSGGAIRLETGVLRGGGIIRAAGGPGDDQEDNGGGGGGGRVAVLLATNEGFDLTRITALGGVGRGNLSRGGVGSVYLRQGGNAVAGELRFDAGALPPSVRTPMYSLPAGNVSTALGPNALQDAAAGFIPGALAGLELNPDRTQSRTFSIVSNDATTLFTDPADGALTVVANIGDGYEATPPRFDRLRVTNQAVVDLLDGNQSHQDRRGRLVVAALDLLTGGVLTHPVATLTQQFGADLTVTGLLTIDADSRVDASAQGFLGGNQGGNGSSGRTNGNVGGSARRVGGSHGGLGAIGDFDPTVAEVYGDLRDPNGLGGGGGADCGGGGNGGGLLRIAAGTVQLDGSILANGQDAPGACGGGGAGGSIKLTTGTLGGSGFIHANGGPGDDQLDNGGGGGGGRVAVAFTDASQFDLAHLEALGGEGQAGGGPGTIFLQPAGAPRGELVVRGTGRETPLPEDYAGDDLTLDGALVSVQSLRPHTLTLRGGTVLKQPPAAIDGETRLAIAADTVTIDSSSRIDVTGRGFRGGNQGGASSGGRTLDNASGSGRRAGGSHGGLGGVGDFDQNPNPVYGDFRDPNQLGSGGGSDCGTGGNGGGLVRLTAATLTVDGVIVADGQDGQGPCGGGGAGGGIKLTVGSFRGAGSVRANGGDGDDQLDNGGGGGGGRVAATYTTLQGFDLTRLEARGGAGVGRGGVGTVFVSAGGAQGPNELRFDGRDLAPSRVTPLYSLQGNLSTALTVNSLTDAVAVFVPGTLIGLELNPDLSQGKTFTVVANDGTTLFTDPADGSMTAVAGSGDIYAAPVTLDRMVVRDRGQLEVIDGDTARTDRRGRFSAANLDVLVNSTLTHPVGSLVSRFGLDFTVSSLLVIDATSEIDTLGKGLLGGNQGGNGSSGRTIGNLAGSGRRVGGSHGGLGGIGDFDQTVNDVYGDPRAPDDPGSGGGADCGSGGNGGGLIRIGAGTLQLDGEIVASGQDAPGACGGGGAGGAINLELGTIQGTGFMRANGGPGDDQLDNGGGGGGGRIALRYNTAGGFDLTHLETLGGPGLQTGGIGTVFTQQNGQRGELVIRGAGRETPLPDDYATDDLTLDGALVSGQSLNPTLLRLRNGAVLRHPPATISAEARLEISAQTVTIDATSQIDVTGRGFRGGNQNGALSSGRTIDNADGSGRRAGGSYGGPGGLGNFDRSPNPVYGDFRNPDHLGSGGGSDCGVGGNGGGLLRLTADTLTLDGTIVADGQDGQGNCGGGGAGGGILLVADTISGAGSVRANGGDGDDQLDDGGGGGGGRVALQVGSAAGFALDAVEARGGNGLGRGGVGTVFVREGGAGVAGILRLDGRGLAPSRETPLYSLQPAISTTVAANALANALASFQSGTLIGQELNPNTAQTATFTVIANDGTTLFTDPADGDMRAVAAAGAPYAAEHVLDRVEIRDNALVQLLDGDGARTDRRGLLTAGTINLSGNARLTHPVATVASWFGIDAQVAGMLSIDATSAIDVSARGLLGGNQDGNGSSGRTENNAAGSGRRVGGGYGGLGGIGDFDTNPNPVYGTAANPDDNGSGGGSDCDSGGNGGGLVRIVAGALQFDGSIAANGQDGQGNCGGGGSGGGIRIETGIVAGTGLVSANGGPGDDQLDNGGGGGGGRVAIYYTAATTFTPANVTASGGPGRPGGTGAAGTIVLQDTDG